MQSENTFKLLIVDDEYAVRENLKRNIDWKGNRIDLVGCAEDGVEAIEWVEKHQPDVVLTDIRMPGMDGILLSKWIKENYPLTKVIFLSAYPEFDYAKSALKYEVADYLLKPVDSSQLLELLHEIRKEMLRESDERLKKQAMTSVLEKNIGILREKYLHDVLEGKYGEDIREIFRLDGMDIADSACIVALVAIENHRDSNNADAGKRDSMDSLKMEMEKYIQRSYKGVNKAYAFIESNQSIGLVWIIQAKDGGSVLSKRIMEELDHLRIHYLESNYVLTIGASSIYAGLHRLKDAYREATRALKARFYLGRGRIIHFPQLETKQGNFSLDIHEAESIYEAMKNYDWVNAQLSLQRYFNYYSANPDILEEHTTFIIYELISILKRVLVSNMCSPDAFINMTELNELLCITTLKEMQAKAVQLFKKSFDLMEKCRISGQNLIIREIKEYVRQNYMHKIILAEVSKSAYLSISALSKLFYKENGMLFTDYLAKVRIDKACEYLLRTDLKIYEISEKVGYHDVKNFNKLFKELVGVTPAEFKKNGRGPEKKN